METRHATDVLSSLEFEQISQLAHRACGLDLKTGKHELVQARLSKKIRQGRFESFKAYYDHVVADPTGQALTALLNALTTNFTSFLREPAHFEFLRKIILPRLAGPIRIWSAACSTGEEPFSIAFSLLEELGPAAFERTRILATDISTDVLATAGQAAYTSERFDALPADWRRKYLLRGSQRWQGWYRVKPQVRGMVEFHRLNLIEPFHFPEPFDAIFCRNVMIYFDRSTQEKLVNRLADCLKPGGYLLVGCSESVNRMKHHLDYVAPSIYRRRLAP